MAKSSRAPEVVTLSRRWCAPLDLPGGPAGEPVFCAASTYTFQAAFFETELLPRFLGLKYDDQEVPRAFFVERERALGTARVVVLVDADHVDAEQTTLRWDQVPVRVPGGVQHSKVTLLVWEKCVRIMVASANLTRSGYRRNHEMVSVLDFHDDPVSAPRALAFELLDFMTDLEHWLRAPEGVISRLLSGVRQTRSLLKGWMQMPAEFRPLDRPRAVFAPTLPAFLKQARRSPLDVALPMWGARRATEITVVTPFVGEPHEGLDPVIERLMQIPRSRDATGTLVVPGGPSERNPEQSLVTLPSSFRNAWATAWRCQPTEVPTYVVPGTRPEDHQRDLHAKAILVSNDDAAMLLCGSSNFSPHGMGIGCANIEANLCVFDGNDDQVDGNRLRARLPVHWEESARDDVIWPDLQTPPDEDLLLAVKHLPSFFRWATFDQRAGVFTIALDREEPEPVKWSVSLADATPGIPPLATTSTTSPEADQVLISRPELRGANVAALSVEWDDRGGVTWKSTLLVQVERLDLLLPPEEFRSMSVEAIMNCLLSGREPEQEVEAQERLNRRKPSNGRSTEGDSLRSVDTANYLTYRTRRLGRALAKLGDRVRRTVRSTEATRHRLQQDPLGPRALADALLREWHVADGEDRSAVVFALAELALMVAHVGRVAHKERGSNTPDLQPLYREFLAELAGLRQETAVGWAPPASLCRYVGEIDEECNRLLGIRTEMIHAD